MYPNQKLITISAEQGQKVNIAGGTYRVVVSGAQTNGTYAIIEMTVPPGAGPVPHAHPNIEEAFYVVEGEILFRSDMGTFIASKGAMVTIPKGGLVHHFKNQTEHPAKLLCTVVPAGLENYFISLSTYLEDTKNDLSISSETRHATIKSIAEQFGQKLLAPNYWEQESTNERNE